MLKKVDPNIEKRSIFQADLEMDMKGYKLLVDQRENKMKQPLIQNYFSKL